MKDNQRQWPRWKFVGTMAGVGGDDVWPLSSWATIQDVDPRVAAIVKDTIDINF
ncbi:MAG: hypothetical protein ABI477_23685 [Chryseolinea sp.]